MRSTSLNFFISTIIYRKCMRNIKKKNFDQNSKTRISIRETKCMYKNPIVKNALGREKSRLSELNKNCIIRESIKR